MGPSGHNDDTENAQGSAEEQIAAEAATAEPATEPTEPTFPEAEPVPEPVALAASDGVIRLKHVFHEQDLIFYMHDGEAPVNAGIVSIPVEFPYWARKAYVMGYRLNPETGEELTFGDVIDAFDRAATAAVEETPGA